MSTTAAVITYQSPLGMLINITPDQEAALKAAGKWPKDASGAEYCQVSHGLHRAGQSDLDREIIESLLA